MSRMRLAPDMPPGGLQFCSVMTLVWMALYMGVESGSSTSGIDDDSHCLMSWRTPDEALDLLVPASARSTCGNTGVPHATCWMRPAMQAGGLMGPLGAARRPRYIELKASWS